MEKTGGWWRGTVIKHCNLQRPSAIVQHIISSVFDNLRSLNLDATLLARWFLACSFYWTQNNQYCLAVFYRAMCWKNAKF